MKTKTVHVSNVISDLRLGFLSHCIIENTATSDMTSRHGGLKRRRTFVCQYVAPPGECYYNTLY